jgi:hypothetical protein
MKQYQKPMFKRVKGLGFVLSTVRSSLHKLVCRQCSGCHGCR